MFVGDLEEEPEDDEEGDLYDEEDKIDEDLDNEDEDEISDDLNFDRKTKSTKASKGKGDLIGKKRKKGKINLEYEYENEDLSNNKSNLITSKGRNNFGRNKYDF